MKKIEIELNKVELSSGISIDPNGDEYEVVILEVEINCCGTTLRAKREIDKDLWDLGIKGGSIDSLKYQLKQELIECVESQFNNLYEQVRIKCGLLPWG